MIDKDDWRLRGQEKYLLDITLFIENGNHTMKIGTTIIVNSVWINFLIFPTRCMKVILLRTIIIGSVQNALWTLRKCFIGQSGRKRVKNLSRGPCINRLKIRVSQARRLSIRVENRNKFYILGE